MTAPRPPSPGGFRLAGSSSSYLRQHADNPVDWWPWQPEAFAEARRRDVPVLVSIGYAACHWCHVMAHESFEDRDLAAYLNEHFVAIKVDREEHPDVDAVYMSATQALTGSGGWPMTCFLDHDGRPFYAGTYFPPRPRHGLPGFRQLLQALVTSWTDNREEVAEAAGRITAALTDVSRRELTADGALDEDALDAVAAAVVAGIDPDTGGFRGAPKFPPAMVCEFLLRHVERTGDPAALAAVTTTLHGMARGGIHDQVGGGFARYSVDSAWHVPHFEKMLDDNALLLRLYTHHARRTGDELSRSVAEGIGTFLLRDLRLGEGGFAVSLDADTDGVEGATYTWTVEQLQDALGERDAALACRLYGVDGVPPDDLPGEVLRRPESNVGPTDAERIRGRLAQVRARRPQPARDEIVVLRSNALTITALAEAGAVLGRPDWVDAAVTAADHLIAVHRVQGRWRRSSRAGVAGPGPALLADQAGFADALLALYQATGDADRLASALQVLDDGLRRFSGDGPGDFADTAADAPALVIRPKDPTDGAAPSGSSTLAAALLTASALSERDDLRVEAEAILTRATPLATRASRSAGWYLASAEALLAGPVQVAVVGPPGSDRDELAATARRLAPGGTVVDVGPANAPDRPLLAGRAVPDQLVSAHVCRHFVCRRPVGSPNDLADELSR